MSPNHLLFHVFKYLEELQVNADNDALDLLLSSHGDDLDKKWPGKDSTATIRESLIERYEEYRKQIKR